MGSSLRYCPICGAANALGDGVCFSCGQSLKVTLPLVPQQPQHSSCALLAPGYILKERYLLLASVGQGGFGAVYKAADTHLDDQLVAIKSINLAGLKVQEIIEATDAFNREIFLLSGLVHPGLPRIHDHFTDVEHWYLVMDFIDGETLEKRLQKANHGRLLFDEALAIALRLCDVLTYLHSRQPPIIFRDLKPANVMQSTSGRLYLIDFGIARHFKAGQAKDTMPLGSPGYAAPEQYGKAQTTPRADIYGLGATLYHLLTGSDPSETPFRFVPLRQHLRYAPTDLEMLIIQMTDLDASKRPASAAAVKQELQRIIDQSIADRRGKLYPLPSAASRPSQPIWIPPQPMPIGTGQAQLQIHLPPAPARAKHNISRRKTLVALTSLACLSLLGVEGLAHSMDALSSKGIMSGPLPPWRVPQIRCTYQGHSDKVNAVAWSPSSAYSTSSVYSTIIASASDDGTVQVWDAVTGIRKLTYGGHDAKVTTLAWLPGSGLRIASADNKGSVHVWNTITGKRLLTYRGHSGKVNAVAWSPIGFFIASASDDGTVQIWSANNGGHGYTYRGHKGPVQAVAWSPDGASIASGSADQTVQVWKVK